MKQADKKQWRNDLENLNAEELEEVNEMLCSELDKRLATEEEELSDRLIAVQDKRKEIQGDLASRQSENTSESSEGIEETQKTSRTQTAPAPSKKKNDVGEAIHAALSDECGPLTKADLIKRLPSFGYDPLGLTDERVASVVQMVLQRLKTKGVVENRGRSIGWAIV